MNRVCLEIAMSTFAVFGMNEHFGVAQLSSMFDALQYAADYADRIRKLGRCRDVIIRAKIKLPQNDLRRKSPTKLSWLDYSPESIAAA